MHKVWYFALICLFLPFNIMGQKKQAETPRSAVELSADSIILFRFLPGQPTFYSPHGENDIAIKKAACLIDQHRDVIVRGDARIVIHGFCGYYPTRAQNLACAKERSNQVKSWFITHHGMKEEYYHTSNFNQSYQGINDVVALIGLEYKTGYLAHPEPQAAPPAEPALEDSVAVIPVAETADTDIVDEPTEQPEPSTIIPTQPTKHEFTPTSWYVKSNLLYDAVLMPSLEVEYRFNQRWSAAVEGNMAWWHNNGKHRYYQLATIVPEVRYWFRPQGDRRGHYLGLFGGGGWYDLENKNKGYQGEGGMVGISYGYQFPVGKHFAFEAGIGVGFLTTKYDEYLPIDGHYVYQQTSRTNYVGPLKLKFAFVWNIGRSAEKGGRK